MKIQFLGTSGHGVTKSRDLPAILVDDHILVDCGEGTFKKLLEINVSPKSINYVFLTHLHSDHISGIASLLWDLAFYSNTPQRCPKIILPEEMSSNLRNIFENSFSPFERIGFDLDLVELPLNGSKEMSFSFGEHHYSVKYTRTIHDPICYAYNFNNLITFSGDTGSPCDNLVQLIKGCKILVHEATIHDDQHELAKMINHSTPCNAVKAAISGGVSSLILNHVPELDRDGEDMYIAQAKKNFNNLSIAHDLDVILIE